MSIVSLLWFVALTDVIIKAATRGQPRKRVVLVKPRIKFQSQRIHTEYIV